MAANIEDFLPNTPYDEVQALAYLLPQGVTYGAVNVEDSTLRKLLTAISKEFRRLDAEMYAVASQFIPSSSTRFVEQWERFLGIPGGCFPILDGIEARAKIIWIKIGLLNLYTKDDYYFVAEILGLTITAFDIPSFGTINISITGGIFENMFTIHFYPHGFTPPEGAFRFGSEDVGIFECICKTYSPAWCQVNLTYV